MVVPAQADEVVVPEAQEIDSAALPVLEPMYVDARGGQLDIVPETPEVDALAEALAQPCIYQDGLRRIVPVKQTALEKRLEMYEWLVEQAEIRRQIEADKIVTDAQLRKLNDNLKHLPPSPVELNRSCESRGVKTLYWNYDFRQL